MKLRRRQFLKGGAQSAAAWCLLPAMTGGMAAGAAAREEADREAYHPSWYPFTGHPDADTCWSLSVGPDGRIYAAACAESVPGGVVKVVRYNEKTDNLDYLFSLDEMVDDPGDSGRATQCKIHYSFAPSMADGVLFMATHLSGPRSISLPIRLGSPGMTRSVASAAALCWPSTLGPIGCFGGTLSSRRRAAAVSCTTKSATCSMR